MTNIILSPQDILNITAFLSSFKLESNEIESLKNVRCELTKNNLSLVMINPQGSLSYNIDIDYNGEDKLFFIESKNLLKILTSTKNTINVSINFETSEMFLHHGRSKTSIRINTETEDYFSPPVVEDCTELEFDSGDLIQSIKEATNFKAKIHTNWSFTGILIELVEDKVSVVATDGFCLYQNTITANVLNRDKYEEVLLLPSTIPSILNFLKLSEKTIVKITDSNISFESANNTLHCKIMDGKFPKYKSIFPTSFQYSIKIKTADLANSIKESLVLNEDIINYKTKLEIDFTTKITKVSHTDNKGQTTISELEFEILEADIAEDVININGVKILNYASVLKEEYIVLHCNTNKPFIITSENNTQKQGLIAQLRN